MADSSKFAGFVEKAADRLEQIKQSLLKHEKNPNDREFINDIFRSVHAIKNGALPAGFGRISELCFHLENFVQREGLVLTEYLSTYLIPSALDVPDSVDSVLVENPDPHGVMGIRGMAEMPFLTVAPVVVAAIHDATGVWVNQLPVTPERLLAAMNRTTDK